MRAHAVVSDAEEYELEGLGSRSGKMTSKPDDAASVRTSSSSHRPRSVREDLDDYGDDLALGKQRDGGGPIRFAYFRLAASFFLFGLLNNVLYVIILSAALDLVPASVPKGIVAFFNIFPALIAKVAWPYMSDGNIRYKRRIYACTALSWTGMVVIASSNLVWLRLCGIGIASFSSGLGELTFLQLSTTVPGRRYSKAALGAWSSGTGGAGIAGAGLWWLLRGLGVTKGLGLASVLPLLFPFTLHLLLPDFARLPHSDADVAQYQPIFVADDDASEVDIPSDAQTKVDEPVLSLARKVELAKPLIMRYMLWLFLVYVFEYIINSGIAPGLAFDVPTSGLWAKVFHSPRDFYPFWSLTYQTFVFISRSSLSLHIPPLPRRFLPAPALLQSGVLTLLALQASRFIFSSPDFRPHLAAPASSAPWWSPSSWLPFLHPGADGMTASTPRGSDRAITVVFLLICLEGLMGGTGYCMSFFHVGREGDDEPDEARRKVEKAFRIGAVGAADSLGILFASLIAMPVEIALCNAQVRQGRDLCRTL